MVVDSEKYPIPSPRCAVGMMSTAMVDPEMVVTPQVSPWAKRRRISATILNALRYPVNRLV